MKTASSINIQQEQDDGYPDLERLIRQRIAEAKGPFFTTNAVGLFETFLNNLPSEIRQHYRCRCCERFIEKYGGLVTIDVNGYVHSVLWYPHEVPSTFLQSVFSLHQIVEYGTKVTGVFLNDQFQWGTQRTGDWTHLSGTPSEVFQNPVKTASQAMAEKLGDYRMIRQALGEYKSDQLTAAVRILEADAVDRSEKALGIARWFRDLHRAVNDSVRSVRDNLTWKAVANAPAGFCHVRSTMISTLLEDLIQELPIEVIKRRWAEKMHPLQYQRPTTLKEGTIQRANEIIVKLESAGSLDRRFAKLEDVTFRVWSPQPIPQPQHSTGGAFDHLRQSKGSVQTIELPCKTMTWEKFNCDVLPTAIEINYIVPHGRQSYCALVTACNPDAPSLFQWDNHVSWYVYNGGSIPAHWNLTAGIPCKVNAITYNPSHWNGTDKFSHINQSVLFILDGCKDLKHERSGGWFPECLKSDYHEIRSAMEAYAQKARILGMMESSASGFVLAKNQTWDEEFQVRTVQGTARYKLDRWE